MSSNLLTNMCRLFLTAIPKIIKMIMLSVYDAAIDLFLNMKQNVADFFYHLATSQKVKGVERLRYATGPSGRSRWPGCRMCLFVCACCDGWLCIFATVSS